MTINWSNTKIGIVGAGISGIAAAELGKHMGADIFISDYNETPEILSRLASYEHEIGGHSDKILDSDLIIISPGVSDSIQIIQNCMSKDIPIISEIEFASWFTTSPILALTGSNGKTTTVHLLHEMCISDGKTSLLGGNVGIPFSENVLWELTSNINSPVHVLELSSFQLEHVQLFSPTICGILNISPDHMDRYENFDAYVTKKLKLAKQKHDLIAISITDQREETLPDVGLIQLEDAESGETLLVDTSDDEMTRHRLRQNNVFGPGGFLGIEDNEALFGINGEPVRRLGNAVNVRIVSEIASRLSPHIPPD